VDKTRKVRERCGRQAPIHDRSTRRWRHLDLGAQRCRLEAEIRRVRCVDCGVKVEEVPFARPGARHTRDFEDLAAFLAQQANKTVIPKLLRIDWATVGRIVERVVADHLDSEHLAGLVMIGVDEVSWRKRHRYLTCVADHVGGGVVWAAEGKSKTKRGRWVKGTRWALLKAPENRTEGQDTALADVQSANKRLYRGEGKPKVVGPERGLRSTAARIASTMTDF